MKFLLSIPFDLPVMFYFVYTSVFVLSKLESFVRRDHSLPSLALVSVVMEPSDVNRYQEMLRDVIHTKTGAGSGSASFSSLSF